jgi:hypothetical protein
MEAYPLTFGSREGEARRAAARAARSARMSVNAPLSMAEVQRLAPSARIMKYSGLARFRHLPPLPLILLYETKPNFGHWVCVVRTPEGIEHFDSYGIVPDNELRWVPRRLARRTGQDVKRLMGMLYRESAERGVPINYSAHRLQGRDTSTCGRWCALRIALSHLPSNVFARTVREVSRGLGLSPDELSVVATR